jgi:hypothetical protein
MELFQSGVALEIIAKTTGVSIATLRKLQDS